MPQALGTAVRCLSVVQPVGRCRLAARGEFGPREPVERSLASTEPQKLRGSLSLGPRDEGKDQVDLLTRTG